jgi:hypothetical protein
MKNIYYVEVTDTFGGEANYSWVKRFKVHASSELGAIRKVGKYTGFAFRRESGLVCDESMYNAKNACVCAFLVDYVDQSEHLLNVVSI